MERKSISMSKETIEQLVYINSITGAGASGTIRVLVDKEFKLKVEEAKQLLKG